MSSSAPQRDEAVGHPAAIDERPQRLCVGLAYAIAVLGPITLTASYLGMGTFWGQRMPFLLLALTFSVVAALGGVWPTALSTLLSVILTTYFLLPPPQSLVVEAPADEAIVVLLALVGLGIGAIGESSRRTHRALARRAVERERELAAQAAEQTATLESLLAHAPVGLAFFDRQARYERVNAWLAESSGLPVRAFRGKTVRELFPAHAGAIEPRVREVFATGRPCEPFSLETEADRHWLTCFYPVRLDGGPVLAAGMLVMEITAQKRSEAALRESEERFRSLFHANIVPLVRWHIDGRITDANDAFVRLVGYSLEELRRGALRWTSFIMPQRAEHLADLVVHFQTTGRFGPEEREYPLRDGRRLPVLVGGASLPGHPYEGVAFILDLTVQKRAETALAAQLALTRTITDNATAALLLVDERGYCTFMNPAAEAMTGHRCDALEDRPLHDWIHHHPEGALVSAAECPLRRALAEGRCMPTHEDTIVREGGASFPALTTSSPVRRDGKVVGTVVEIRDITEQTRIQHERESLLESERAARAEAERANRQKDEFVAALSHELRTPLNAVLGWTRLAARPNQAAAERERALGVVERNARLLSQIIADLLDVSSIASGKLRVERAPVEVRSIVVAALDTMRDAAEAKGIRLDGALDGSDAIVHGDATRLQQVVWNLLSNAVKFTPRGGAVHVSLGVTTESVEIVVSDTGKGIEPAFLPHLFERGRQAETSEARRYGGLGLGLSIVKHLVERHGGTVRAESAGSGQGARFIVTLPLAAGAEIDAPRDAAAMAAAQLAGARILVVDDEPEAKELVKRLLEEQGAAVLTASSGSEALAAIACERLDAVVSDIGMPGMDGYELMRRVRAGAKDVPAVALTAYVRQEDRARALDAGFQAHVAKPVEPAELFTALTKALTTETRAHAE